jgi:hypothetical protein
MAFNKQQYYQANRARIIQHQLEYYHKNKDKYSLYYRTNKPRIIQRQQRRRDNNPLRAKCLAMVHNAKSKDIISNRPFEMNEFITTDYLMDLYQQQNGKCYYECCKTDMLLSFDSTARDKRLLTLQRLNNDIAHTINNSVLSCFDCNCIKHRENDNTE